MLVELRSQLTAGGGSAGVPAATVSTSIPWDLSVALREPLILKPGTKIALVNVLLTSDGSLDSWTVPAAGYQFSFVIGSAMLTPIVVTVAGGIYTGAAFATALTTQMQAAFVLLPRLVTQLNVAKCEWRWVPPVSAGADGNFVLDMEWEAGGEIDMTDTLVQFNPFGPLETTTASLPPAYDSQQASYINGTIYKKTGFLSDDWNTAVSPAVGANLAGPTSTMDTRLTHPLHPYLLGSKSTPKREGGLGYFSCTLAAPPPGQEYSIDLNVSGDATAISGYRLPAGNEQGATSDLYGWQSTATDDTVTSPAEVYQFESYVGENDFDYEVYLKIDDGTGAFGFTEKMYLHSASKFTSNIGPPGTLPPSVYYAYATDRAVELTAAGLLERDGQFVLDVEHVNAVIAGVRPRLTWSWTQPALPAANQLPELEIASDAGAFTQDWGANTSTFVRVVPSVTERFNFKETDSGAFTRWWVLQPTYLNHGRGGLADVEGGLLGVAGTPTFSVYGADPTLYQSVPNEIWVLSGEAELTCAQVFPTPGRAGLVAGGKLTAAAAAGPIELTGQQWPWVGWGKEPFCQSVNGNVPIQLDSWSAIIKNARKTVVTPGEAEALTISLAYKGTVYRTGDGAGEEHYTGDQFRWIVQSLDEEGATEEGYLPFCEVTTKASSQNADPLTWVWQQLTDVPPAGAKTIDSRDLVYCGITAPGTLPMRLGFGYDKNCLATPSGAEGMVQYPTDFTQAWTWTSSARVNEVAGTGGFNRGDILIASHVQAGTTGQNRRYVVRPGDVVGNSNLSINDVILATPGFGYANGDVVRFFCLRDPRIQIDITIGLVGQDDSQYLIAGSGYTVGARYTGEGNLNGTGAVLVCRATNFSQFDIEDPGYGFQRDERLVPTVNIVSGGVHPGANTATILLGAQSLSWDQQWLGTLRTLNREWGLPGDTGYGARDAMTPQNKCVIETAVGANGGVNVVVGNGTVNDGTPESEWILTATDFGAKHPLEIEATGVEVDAPNANNSEILVQLPSFPIDSRNAAGYSDNHIAAVPFEQSSNAAGANKSWVQPYSLLYQRTCNNHDLTINEVKCRFTDWRGRPRTDLIHPTGVTLSVQPDSL